MPSLGEHWIHNSLSILGLATYFKINFTEILGALSSFGVPQGRGNIINHNSSQFFIILLIIFFKFIELEPFIKIASPLSGDFKMFSAILSKLSS